MWDILEVTHEGTNDVKRARKHAFIQEYELFRMQKGETICDVQKRFSHIVNHLMSVGKTFYKEELNIKILKCLDRTWQPKVTAISESKDLTSMTAASFFGKLREHELEMNRLVVQESEDKHHKRIALKACKQQQDSSGSDEDTMSLLSRKLSKFLKKSQASKRYGSKNPMILILTNTPVMAVVNRVISRKNALTVKSKKKQISKMRKGQKLKRLMWHGMKMMFHPQALLMMKK